LKDAKQIFLKQTDSFFQHFLNSYEAKVIKIKITNGWVHPRIYEERAEKSVLFSDYFFQNILPRQRRSAC
jgi:hypothetical protein